MSSAEKELYDYVMDRLCKGVFVVDDSVDGGLKWGKNISIADNDLNNYMSRAYGEYSFWGETWDKALADYKKLPLIQALS